MNGLIVILGGNGKNVILNLRELLTIKKLVQEQREKPHVGLWVC